MWFQFIMCAVTTHIMSIMCAAFCGFAWICVRWSETVSSISNFSKFHMCTTRAATLLFTHRINSWASKLRRSAAQQPLKPRAWKMQRLTGQLFIDVYIESWRETWVSEQNIRVNLPLSVLLRASWTFNFLENMNLNETLFLFFLNIFNTLICSSLQWRRSDRDSSTMVSTYRPATMWQLIRNRWPPSSVCRITAIRQHSFCGI